jgi:hypothetical protein
VGRDTVDAVLANPTLIVLIAFAAPWVALGGIALYLLRNKNGNGKGERANGPEPQATLAGVNGALEAVKLMVKQVLDRTHALEAAISALRKENRARADSDAALRERVAAIESRQGHDGRTAR